MHDKKVCHQDIKPENILIFEKNGQLELKLCDLEFAGEKTTMSGTAPYLPPEAMPHTWEKAYKIFIAQSFGYQCYENEKSYTKEAIEWYERFLKEEASLAYGKDMWGVGVPGREILFGSKPDFADYKEIMAKRPFNLLFSARIADREDINKIIREFAIVFNFTLDEKQLESVKSSSSETRKMPMLYKANPYAPAVSNLAQKAPREDSRPLPPRHRG